jgi:uncharacterized coiled-coil DUF342 family protein
MKLVDEKKALQEITTLRRARKQLESSGSVDDAIAADKARIDELRKQLDDPEARKVSDKFDELKKEMDTLREEGNKAFEERGKLFDERNALSAKMVSGARFATILAVHCVRRAHRVWSLSTRRDVAFRCQRRGTVLMSQDELYGKKRESAQKFREDNDK